MGAKNFDIFTGSANPDLASDVSKILGMDISHADVGQFSDGEIKVQIEKDYSISFRSFGCCWSISCLGLG